MARKEGKSTVPAQRRQRPMTHRAGEGDVDTTEEGPSRLYAPGKPHEVESGPSRLQMSTSGQGQVMLTEGLLPTQVVGTADTTEAGPARLERFQS
jgi:hypothetical protein